jgi:spore maturation protein CgeB
MKILYHFVNPDTIYAGKSIYNGYKNAFKDLGHEFETLTKTSNLKETFDRYSPDIFITSLSRLNLRGLDLSILREQREKGLKVFSNTPVWNSPISKYRINEDGSLSNNKELIQLIKSAGFADCYYNVCEQGDLRMEGFEKVTGYRCHTIPLAADKIILKPVKDTAFSGDISYVGTNLSGKRKFMKEYVFPLKKEFYLKLYGQDWSFIDRTLGWVQRFGQYFDLPYLKSLLKQPMQLEDEAKVYFSSLVSINIHEDVQKEFGGECNERTFKIPLSGGFEVTDDVACIRKYFDEGKEIIIAKSKDDWFEKIRFYIKNPEKRFPIIEAGRKRVLRDHTYHNRVEKIFTLYEGVK